MKLFKIDEYKLYEKYFENMKVSEFFALDHIPENVEPEHMRNIAEFLKAEKEYQKSGSDEKNSHEQEFDSMLIEDVIIRKMIENGDINIDEIMQDSEK